jgi:hypothetical protein
MTLRSVIDSVVVDPGPKNRVINDSGVTKS